MPESNPLYRQAVRIPSWKQPALSVSCQPVGGSNGEPQNYKSDQKMTGLRHNDRISKRSKPRHRGITEIGLTSGKVHAAQNGVNIHALRGKREMRALAIKVLRDRGEKVNNKAIAGILSGKTL